MELIRDLLTDSRLMNNMLLITFFVVFGVLFFKEHRSEKSPLQWTDMLIDSDSGKLSISKLGNFIGIVVSTWIMIYLVQEKESYPYLASLFMSWLAFMGGVYTLNNFIKSKNNK